MNYLRVKRCIVQRFLKSFHGRHCAYQWKCIFLGKGFSSGSSVDLWSRKVSLGNYAIDFHMGWNLLYKCPSDAYSYFSITLCSKEALIFQSDCPIIQKTVQLFKLYSHVLTIILPHRKFCPVVFVLLDESPLKYLNPTSTTHITPSLLSLLLVIPPSSFSGGWPIHQDSVGHNDPDQRLANIFWKGMDSTCFLLCKPYSLLSQRLNSAVAQKHTHTTRQWMRKCVPELNLLLENRGQDGFDVCGWLIVARWTWHSKEP